MCPRCMEIETPIQVIRDCSFVKNIWLSFPTYFLFSDFFNLDLHQWCKKNTKVNALLGYVPWGVVFAFVLWAIWLDRNSLIFSNHSVPSQVLRHNAVSHVTKFFFLSFISTQSSIRKSSVLLRWCPSPFPFVTINTNGSSSGNPGPTGVGGLARTHVGTWLWGFSLNLGCTNNTVGDSSSFESGMGQGSLAGSSSN